MSSESSTPAPGPEAPQREVKLWKPPADGPARLPPDLPESYYNPSSAELMRAHSSQTRLRETLVDAPLKTRAMREREERAKKSSWPQTKIRIRFSDRSQLETTFPSSVTVREVYDFVDESLAPGAKDGGYVLYQSPPKREFKLDDPRIKELSLYDLKLAPSSVLLIRFTNEALNASSAPAPLIDALRTAAVDLPAPPSFDPTPEAATKQAAQPEEPKPKAREGLSKGIPKWLQKGLKK